MSWCLANNDAVAPARDVAPTLRELPPLCDGDEDPTTENGRPSWVEVKDGFDFCTLCHVFATDGHLASERHRKKLWWHEWSILLHDPDLGPPEIWGDATHFEWREGWWWCRLCARWADGSHVQGKRHLKRYEWADWYMSEDNSIRSETSSSMAAISAEDDSSAPVAAISGGFGETRSKTEPWGPSWQAAVRARALPPAINSGQVVARQSAPPKEPAASTVQTAPAPLEPDSKPDVLGGSPWRREWSDDHRRNYFWNEHTGESRWDLPEMYTGGGSDVEWC